MRVSESQQQYRLLLDALANALGPDWRVLERVNGRITWRVFKLLSATLPAQGWKIHITVAAIEYEWLCRLVLPVLIEAQATFKVPGTIENLLDINSGMAGKTQIGKVVTVYPQTDHQAADLAIILDKVWPLSKGPRVVSDLALRPVGTVF